MAKKVILTRDDGADYVIETINTSRESALTIVAPRGSALADREALIRIAQAAGDRDIALAIESVDEELLALAHGAHIEAVHPFFRADRRHLSLDGIVRNEVQHPKIPVHAEEDEDAHEHHIAIHTERSEQPAVHDHPLPTPVIARREEVEDEGEEEHPTILVEEKEPAPKRRGRLSKLRLAITALVTVALIAGVGEVFFRGGSVDITLAETPWEYTTTITAGTAITKVSEGSLSIPGQLFPDTNRNIAQSFAATGEPGAVAAPTTDKPKVTVYNESLQAETFVMRTRFEGKSGIFRAATAVAIPAAKKEGDKLVAGSATVEVVPDSDAVLTGATDGEKLTVPGLAGSEKATLFYGTLALPQAAPVEKPANESTVAPKDRTVTASDEEGAKKKIIEMLATSHKVKVVAQSPGLTVIDGAVTVVPTQLTVNKEVDEQGNFNLVGQAEVQALAFKEDDLKQALLMQATAQTGVNHPITFRNVEVRYSNVTPNFKEGKMTFDVTVKGMLIGQLDETAIRKELAGKTRGAITTWLASRKEIKEGTASIRPFWRFTLPIDPTDFAVTIK
jgi:hypothetical protein